MREYKFFRDNWSQPPLIEDEVGGMMYNDSYVSMTEAGYIPSVNQVNVQFNPPIPYELKRENRFFVSFPEEYGLQDWMVKSITRPSLTVTDFKREWSDITVHLHDAVGPSTSQAIMRLMTDESLEQRNNMEFTVNVLDPTGISIEQWRIYGLIRSVDFGGLTYYDDNLVDVTVTFAVHHAELVY